MYAEALNPIRASRQAVSRLQLSRLKQALPLKPALIRIPQGSQAGLHRERKFGTGAESIVAKLDFRDRIGNDYVRKAGAISKCGRSNAA